MATKKPYNRRMVAEKLCAIAEEISRLDDDIHQRGVVGAKSYSQGRVSRRIKMRRHSLFLLRLDSITDRIDSYLKNIYHVASGISKPGEYR